MLKSRENSKLEIWTASYINAPNSRNAEDRNMTVVQIEPTGNDGDYIVEIVEEVE